MVGLSNVDDTPDASKPISTLTQAALTAKAPTASPTFTGTVSGITKAMIGLSNVDDTSDASKPISTLTQAALNAKANLAGDNTFTGSMTVNSILYNDIDGQGYFTQLYHNINGLNFLSRNDYFNGATGTQLATNIKFYCYDTSKAQKNILTLNPTSATLNGNLSISGTTTGITKAMVNLANVDNVADVNKVISISTQAALNAKAPTASPTFTGTVSGITKAMVGLGNVDDTSDLNKPVSTLTQVALDYKAPTASPEFTGTITTSANIYFINGIAATNNINNVNKITFDYNYGASVEKIILYNGGSPSLNYSLGVLADTLFYSSYMYHKFYIGGATTTPILSISSTGATFTGTVAGITKTMVGLGNVDNTTDLDKQISTLTQTALDSKAATASPTFSGTVNCNGALVINSGVTLSNSSLPTAGQLGSNFSVTSNTGVGLSSSVTNRFTITNLTIGVWLITGAISCTSSLSCTVTASLSANSATVNSANIISSYLVSNIAAGIHFTWTLTNATTSNYYITCSLSGSSTVAAGTITQWATCTRIG